MLLSASELRAKTAEQRALRAEEALQAALDKIQDLERKLESGPSPVVQTDEGEA